MKGFAATVALIFFTGTSAFAADMALKAPPPAPAAPSWTGFYIGVDGGYGWGNGNLLGDPTDNPCCAKEPSGGFGGGLVGYNYQINQFLVGIETDLQGADIRQTNNDQNFGDVMNTKIDWFGTLRGRIGFLPNSALLLYVTGGIAYGRVNNSVAGPVLTGSPYNIDRTANGSSLGGGAEYKFAPNLTARVEYQYINLGKNDPTNAAGQPYDHLMTFVNRNKFSSIRFGVSYLFGPH